MTTSLSLSRIAVAAALAGVFAASPVAIAVTGDGWTIEAAKAHAKDGRDDDDDRSDDRDRSGKDDDDDRGRRGRGGDDDDRGRRGRGRGADDSRSGGIEVMTADGGRIEIENGRYERKDASGRTVVERPATAADYAALGMTPRSSASAQTGSAAGGTNGGRIPVGYVVKAEISGANIEVTYSRGWKEEIENGRYELKDPANRTVIERPATAGDRSRLAAAAN